VKTIDDPELRAYVVWQPIRGGRAAAVPDAMATFPDRRATHFWDAGGWTIANFKPPLDIQVDAWDLYMMFGPDARWDGELPPEPDFWMHQLWGVDNGPALEAGAFAARIRQALSTSR
jgi:hypothetical protein